MKTDLESYQDLMPSRKDARIQFHQSEEQIRKSPATAVLGATAAGYLLHRLLVRAILLTQVRVLLALTPPALLLFGAAKLYEILQRQQVPKPELADRFAQPAACEVWVASSPLFPRNAWEGSFFGRRATRSGTSIDCKNMSLSPHRVEALTRTPQLPPSLANRYSTNSL